MATSEKIQLKGASQYKKDLQQIVAQSKALDSEMKLIKSSFDKSTSAEQKNEAIGKQLTKQIQTQQQYVQKLTQAYEAEVKASGEQSVAALKAKDALLKGQTALKNMEAENQKLAEAENKETTAAQNNEKAHASLNGVLKAAGVAIAAVATAAATAAKAVWDATTAAGQWADNLLTLSATTDISTDTLQKWDYAARFIDVDTDTMAKGLKKIQKAETNAISSKKKFIQILGGVKISLKDVNGQMKSTEQVFYEAIDAIGQIKDETKRNAAAQDLFGNNYAALKPLIDAGTEGLREYCDEAERLGIVLSEDDVGALGQFDDEVNRFKASMETAGKELALAFLPATKEIAESLTELARTVSDALKDGFQEEDVDTIIDPLFKKLSDGLDKLDKILPAITKLVTGVVKKILELAIKNLPTLAKTALTIVMGLANSLIAIIAENAPMLIQAALDIITSLADGLVQSLPVLIPAIVECIMTIATKLMEPESVSMLIDAAIAIMQALGEGLINALPILAQMLPQLLVNIAGSLISEGTRLYEVATSWIDKLIEGINSGNIWGEITKFFNEKIAKPFQDGIKSITGVGKALVEGLWNGISDKAEWIKSQIRSWTNNVIQWFKNFLKIGSPSKVMADEIGVNMARGIAAGLTDGMSYVKSALGMTNGLINSAFSFGGAGAGGVTVYIDGIKYNTDEYVDSSITNFVESMVRRGQMYGR